MKKALAFIAEHPTYAGDYPWCWVVMDFEIGDPKMVPHDKLVLGKDGQKYGNPNDAMEACAPKAPTPG